MNTLKVEGMSCTNCALGVKKQLEKLGFEEVRVDFAGGEASFNCPSSLKVEDAVDKINGMGYQAFMPETESKGGGFHPGLKLKFWFSLIFTLPLLTAMFLPWHWLHQAYIQMLICLPVFVLGLWHFGRSGFHSLKAGVPNMDVLVSMGSIASFAYSVYGTLLDLGHDYMFYETTASIISMIFLGNLIEHISVKKTTSALDALLRLQKVKAKRVLKDGIEEVDAEQLKKGDLILVNTGDHIPVDGRVVWGQGSADESIISGESLAVEKLEGDSLTGGCILLSGSVKFRAEAVGNDTVLASIIDMVKRAREEKPQFQHLADKVSAIFVPLVVGIALLCFILSFAVFSIGIGDAILHSIAVLVIACPCAMGLAIPTAVMVGVGHAARNGILIKGGITLEKFSRITHMAFDKTGTLTRGKFSIQLIECAEGVEISSVKSWILGLEKYSSHPIALSLLSELRDEIPAIFLKTSEEKGLGLAGIDVDQKEIRLGSWRYAGAGCSVQDFDLYLSVDGRWTAGILLGDEMRPEAAELLAGLKGMGIHSLILSGDREKKVAYLAQQCGIPEYYADLLPEQKLEKINALSLQGTVAMIGDGVNDAPSLTAASVGVSFGNASPVAIASAEIVLLGNNLRLLEKALIISRKTLATMKQNLFWAFAYNLIAIPLAAMGYLNPMLAAFSMAFSDVIVVGNSLRLYRQRN